MTVNRIVVLCNGGGPALPGQGVPGTSALLDLDGRRIVIDAGPGVAPALVRAAVDLKSIDTVCITHLQAGHMLDLGTLVHGIWLAGRTAPLTLWGPPGIGPCWQGFLTAMAQDVAIRVAEGGPPPLRDMVTVRVLQDGVAEDGPLRMSALHVPHPPIEHCLALRFAGTRTVTFAASTAFYPPLAAFALKSDVLVHPASLWDAPTGYGDGRGGGAGPGAGAGRSRTGPPHATPDQAGRIARVARAGRLVLHPMVRLAGSVPAVSDWTDAAARHWRGAVVPGHDGLEIML